MPTVEIDESAAGRYHRLTGYVRDRHWLRPADDPRIRGDFVPMPADRRPAEWKTYPAGLRRVALPRRLSPVTDRGGQPFDVAELAGLLHHTAGIVRWRPGRNGPPVLLRAAASAGNLHPIETYLHTAGVDRLDDGVWHYDARRHQLVHIGPACGSGVALVLSAVPWRSEWKYAERGYRHVLWDAGTVTANATLLAAGAGRSPLVRIGFGDADVAAAIGADGVREVPLALIDLAGGPVELRPDSPAAAGELGAPGPEFPLVDAAHAAGNRTTWPAVGSGARPQSAEPGDPSAMASDERVRRRSATRRFVPEAVIPAVAVREVLTRAIEPVSWDAGPDPLRYRLVVHHVEGWPPGVYRWTPDGESLLREGDLRAEAVAACTGQAAAGACACLLLCSADLGGVLGAGGDRAYRALQLRAGLVAGRLQLMTVAEGLGSSPLTLHDENASSLVGAGEAGLLAVAVGRPAVLARPGGPPTRPTRLMR
ncbi:MAG: hypothetical protein ABW046_13710 [Actinoplanes sp.]